MAIKKSELYRSLWASADQLRGGMDASMYKDYVLVMLFLKYISDKATGSPFDTIKVPPGASFEDMRRMKGKPNIGDLINKQVIQKIAEANGLGGTIDVADFDDSSKLGDGKDKTEKLTKLIAIFEDPSLDFSGNQADGDDILGDAYEFLMRHFASESGKSKGQFYTPGEVSRIMAKILEIDPSEVDGNTTVFDPACGSGSLLLRVAAEAGNRVSLYGQENDVATTGLARMNMVLHGRAADLQEIQQGNTLANPKHKSGEDLKRFDFIVANPPFSYKSWANGINVDKDEHHRFDEYGTPPDKNGDYAWILHILRTLKKDGRAAVILPHGVLFRGNAEAEIRKNLIRRGLVKAIIGLPANLFYGTGIPACILLLDKADAVARKGIFMIDASRGFLKDGNKNKLRERDIHRIVDVFTRRAQQPGFSRLVPVTEIAGNDFNLNLPRYIDGREADDVQDIAGHLQGGIPNADIDGLGNYWAVYPGLKKTLFRELRPGYQTLRVDRTAVRDTIFQHPEFTRFSAEMDGVFNGWRKHWTNYFQQYGKGGAQGGADAGCRVKDEIAKIGTDLLARYTGKPLLDPYAVYQHLLDYWYETLQDDLYLLHAEGWLIGGEVYRLTKTTKTKDKEKTVEIKGIAGIESKLIAPQLLIDRYFAEEQAALNRLQADIDAAQAEQAELAEEHGGEDAAFGDLDKVSKASVGALYKSTKGDPNLAAERKVMKRYLDLAATEATRKKEYKELEDALEREVWTTYGNLNEAEIKTLVIEDKWMAHLAAAVAAEQDRISQRLATRVGELADRYATPLPTLNATLADLEAKVNNHLAKMGYQW